MSKLGKISLFFAGLSLVSLGIIRYLIGEWVPFCWLALILTLFFVGLTIFWDRKFFKEFATMKTTKEGMSMGSLILLMFSLLIVINYLGLKHYKTWDFSAAQVNTLSEQSVQIVKTLQTELKVLFFYKKGVQGNEENRRQFRELVKRYQDHSPLIHLEFIEANEQPDLARDYGVDRGTGIAFVDYKGQRSRLEKIDEQELTSAIVKATRTKEKNIYFVIGHGEKNLDDAKEGLGLNSLKLMLENNRYTVKTLPLLQSPRVPDDADAVVVAGPSQRFQNFELAAIEDYLKRGGSLLLALEPQANTGFEQILSKLGVKLGNNYIVNAVETSLGRGIRQGPAVGAVFSKSNQITKIFGANEATLFRYPQSLTTETGKPMEGLHIESLVKTSSDAEAFSGLDFSGIGLGGSYDLVDFISGKWQNDKNNKDFNMILSGDVDFMTNQLLYQNLNRDLILNSIAALAKEETLISISPKEPEATQLHLTDTKFAIFLFSFIIPFPLIMLAVSVTLHLRRRNA